jgi:hypothetical protein
MRTAVMLTICAAVAAGCGRPASTSTARPPAATSEASPPASLPMPARPAPPLPVWRVVSVHDGDTLRAIDEGKVEQRIRLAGIDAPERGQPFGNVARDGISRGTATTSGWPQPSARRGPSGAGCGVIRPRLRRGIGEPPRNGESSRPVGPGL